MAASCKHEKVESPAKEVKEDAFARFKKSRKGGRKAGRETSRK